MKVCPEEVKTTPGGIRTPDRRIRNPLLYPAELRAQVSHLSIVASSLGLSMYRVDTRKGITRQTNEPAWVTFGELFV